MTFTDIKKTLLALVVTFSTTAASAQGLGWPVSTPWTRVASAIYPGGVARVAIPFAIEVETTELALTVPQFCAPRALASRAEVIDNFNFRRLVDLRFLRQEVVGGYIRAYYTVANPFSGGLPLVTGLLFSFAPVNPNFSQACQLAVFARPGIL